MADELSGRIVFINSHDYVGGGQGIVGCLASIRGESGQETLVYTKSLRLQHTLEMAYATGRAVRVALSPKKADAIAKLLRAGKLFSEVKGGAGGLFLVRAMWTLE